ncbi:MAG TPA: hypothetical protein VNN10_15175 [Dehalococcoidia bacterium]|nr:hypothetical protein [Dehalococcoidia bacterium]
MRTTGLVAVALASSLCVANVCLAQEPAGAGAKSSPGEELVIKTKSSPPVAAPGAGTPTPPSGPSSGSPSGPSSSITTPSGSIIVRNIRKPSAKPESGPDAPAAAPGGPATSGQGSGPEQVVIKQKSSNLKCENDPCCLKPCTK